MKILLTGLSGTVAPVLAERLRRDAQTIVRWNRNEVPPDDLSAVETYINATRPAAICHLATGSPEWAEAIARIADRGGARVLYASSVSVFSIEQRGPFTCDVEPRPIDDYGRYKRDCEQRIWR